MSYSEDVSGNVTLTMTRDDYSRLLIVMGMATGAALMGRGLKTVEVLGLLNRLNEGNPNYAPYATTQLTVGRDPEQSRSGDGL